MKRVVKWFVDAFKRRNREGVTQEFRYKTTITEDLRRIVFMCDPDDLIMRWAHIIANIENNGKREMNTNIDFPFIQSHVKKLLEFMKQEQDNEYYHYVFIKYEPSIHTVANTLEDALSINNEISEELMQYTEKILRSFGKTLAAKQQVLLEIENREKEVVSKSHIERMEFEVEYIDKYIDYKDQ